MNFNKSRTFQSFTKMREVSTESVMHACNKRQHCYTCTIHSTVCGGKYCQIVWDQFHRLQLSSSPYSASSLSTDLDRIPTPNIGFQLRTELRDLKVLVMAWLNFINLIRYFTTQNMVSNLIMWLTLCHVNDRHRKLLSILC